MQPSLKWQGICAAGVVTVFLAVAAVVPSLRAADENKELAKANAAATQGDEPDMNDEMEKLNKALQKITRDYKNPKKIQSTLAAVTDLQMQTIKTKAMQPGGAATKPAEEVPHYLKEYRIEMADVLRETADLEQAIIRGENDKVAASIKKLRDLEKKGHQVYQPPKEEDENSPKTKTE